MTRLTLILLASALCYGHSFSQVNPPVAASLSNPNGSGETDPGVRFTILLGPNLEPGVEPFLDPYRLSEQLTNVPLDKIGVDIETPLPTQPGPSLHVRVPVPKEAESDTKPDKHYQLLALRFGITRVHIQPVPSLDAPEIAVRVGVNTNRVRAIDWNKFVLAAKALSSDPSIEVFDETALVSDSAGDSMMAAGGMGMYSGDYTGVGMEGYGAGGYSLSETETQASWAEPTGMVEGDGMLVSWSLKDNVVAAIDSETSSDWIRTQLSGNRMTTPVVVPGMCVFVTDDTAYGFSAKASTWAKHKFESASDSFPVVTVSNQSATIKTANDVLIFTQAGRWLSRNNATDLSQQRNLGMGLGSDMGLGMRSELGMGMMDGMGGYGMDMMGGGMGGYGMSGMSDMYQATGVNILAPADTLRDTFSKLESTAKGMAKQLKVETGEDAKQKLREGLGYVTQQLLIAECDLQRAELVGIQNKISQLTHQILQRRQRTQELVDARVEEMLKE